MLPTQGNAWRLTWLYFLTGSPADLSVAARQAIDRGEYPAEIHQLLALEALREGDSEFAIAALESAIEVDPNRVQPHVNLGLALVGAGRLEAAGSAFERGLQYLPSSTDLLYNAGLVRAYLADTPGAMKRFEQTLGLDPENLPARENLAGLLASMGRYEESVGHYRLAIEQSSDDADTHYLLARALLGLGDGEGAQQALQECLRLEPEHEEAIILRSSLETQRLD